MEANFHPLFYFGVIMWKTFCFIHTKKPLTYLIAATAFAAGHLSATLMLSDQEYLDFLSAYSQLIQKHLTNEPSEGRKARKITFISSPT